MSSRYAILREPVSQRVASSRKTIGGMRRPMLHGIDRVGWSFSFVAAAYKLVRLPKLLLAAA